ncbi:WD40 repeat-like protein [Basidiobolus meristosporus CBS 931.73]|uniref:Ribosome biogenesis protein NSA1 n=1 Tax=Basidiobolus meristosporus CBS 931.73 TaxID=1314790 RepID=A0A1Y1YFW7_9FUNG|nr:WD40 repeat-like protein [Basidiobolus meristosporus CBS 931.73]|eukprot:ORX96877.1 WD40 repeat-like protein [Basidiobolus meristosporus CBS 931.73]
MKLYTGDETGLLKVVTPAQPKEVKKPKKAKVVDDEDEEVKKKDEKEPKATILTYGKVNRDEAIQQLLVTKVGEEKLKMIVAARKSGKIQYILPSDGSVRKEFIEEFPTVAKKEPECVFVGLHSTADTVITCTNYGSIKYRSILKEADPIVATLDAGKDICSMAVHPQHSNILATGGKERDLNIWDINQAEPIFKAKNVKNDFLDLRVPVWITATQFLNEDTHKVVVGTKYHQIRLYDAKSARRPVLNVEIGEHPIVSLTLAPNQTEIICSDSIGNLSAVDIRTGKLIHTYKGIVGAIQDVDISSESAHQVCASVSLDRFLRIHEISGSRKLLHKIYLKQKLTRVVIDEEEDGEAQPEEDEDEELWKNMRKVSSTKKRKQKIAA